LQGPEPGTVAFLHAKNALFRFFLLSFWWQRNVPEYSAEKRKEAVEEIPSLGGSQVE
jgi:hypothetical protein